MSGFDWADECLEFQTEPARDKPELPDEKPVMAKPNPFQFAPFE